MEITTKTIKETITSIELSKKEYRLFKFIVNKLLEALIEDDSITQYIVDEYYSKDINKATNIVSYLFDPSVLVYHHELDYYSSKYNKTFNLLNTLKDIDFNKAVIIKQVA